MDIAHSSYTYWSNTMTTEQRLKECLSAADAWFLSENPELENTSYHAECVEEAEHQFWIGEESKALASQKD